MLKYNIIIKPETSCIKKAIQDQLKDLYLKASSQNEIEELDLKVLQAVLNKEVIDEALIILIIIQNLLFRIVKWPEFYIFL